MMTTTLGTSTYRTTSTPALCVLANVLPLEERILELLNQTKQPDPFHSLEKRVQPSDFPHPSLVPTINYGTVNNFDQLRDLPRGETEIYTDGSKSDEGTGASFVVFKGGQETFFRLIHLGTRSTIFQAETIALEQSLKYIISENLSDVSIF